MRAHYATPRAFPWRSFMETLGAILAIGGGIVAVSTPAIGGICFGLGLLALLSASAK